MVLNAKEMTNFRVDRTYPYKLPHGVLAKNYDARKTKLSHTWSCMVSIPPPRGSFAPVLLAKAKASLRFEALRRHSTKSFRAPARSKVRCVAGGAPEVGDPFV